MSESKPRHRRIEGEMQRAIAELVSRGVKDPRVGSVTITEVKIAADMSSAKVYFTPFASKSKPEDVLEGLTHAAGYLRGEVGRRLSLRHAPRLEFELDDSFEKAAKLTELIDKAPK
jgi:ribosome-binding factor A